MENSWYYVENGERRGPISEAALIDIIRKHTLSENDYVWAKGFPAWKKIQEVPSLKEYLNEVKVEELDVSAVSVPVNAVKEKPYGLDFSSVAFDERIFTIKTGHDRGGDPSEYGPFSIEILKKLFSESRISGKTLIFAPGMEDWKFLAEIPIFEKIFGERPPTIDEADKRKHSRKPFIARMFFHGQSKLFEGICRDISTGGIQVLVHNFPGKAGDKLSLNVHPENSEYCFVASGKIVRILEGGQGFSLRFLNLSNEARAAIENYVEKD